jgi:hypothetical protein
VVNPPEKEGTAPKVAYRQEGYHYDGMCNPAEDFNPVGQLDPLGSVPPQDYYRGEYLSGGKSLKVPADLSDSFDRYYSLEHALQDRFLNACYWLGQANFASSLSMTFLAAIQAIETLVDPATGGTTCEQCGLTKRPGPTQQFAAFLKRYVPSDNGGDKGCRLLYEVRSGLSHGYYPPFLVDTEISGALHPAAYEQGRYVSLALTSARVAMHNWLHDAR